MEGNLRYKIGWARLQWKENLPFLLCFTLHSTANTSPPRGLYLEGRFNGGFFALQFWGAYIWRSLYMEGLIFGILRYVLNSLTIISLNEKTVEEAAWRSGQCAGLAIRQFRVWVPLWPLAGFVLGPTEFKSSATLVKSQLIAYYQLLLSVWIICS